MLCGLLPLAQLALAVVLLLLEVGVLLHLGLVEPVDYGVFALHHVDFFDLGASSGAALRGTSRRRGAHQPVVLEADLAVGHTAVLFQVRPRRVYDGDVVLLVS